MNATTRFFSEEITFKLTHPRKTSLWIKFVIQKEKKSLGKINFVFCNDAYLLQINQDYLNHNSYTDIITFDSSETKDLIEGEIYISIERIQENSVSFQAAFDDELHRVIIHGVLHLVGYSDKTDAKRLRMRRKEDAYLSLRKSS